MSKYQTINAAIVRRDILTTENITTSFVAVLKVNIASDGFRRCENLI